MTFHRHCMQFQHFEKELFERHTVRLVVARHVQLACHSQEARLKSWQCIKEAVQCEAAHGAAALKGEIIALSSRSVDLE